MEFPILNIDRVAHVGSLDASHKARGSYEGSGLSVSLHPLSWASIAKLGDSGFILEREGARFIDRMAVGKADIEAILQWGRERGLVEDGMTWRVSYYDADDEARRFFTVASREDAEAEAEILENPRITGPKATPRATQALLDLSMQDRPDLSPDMVVDLVLMAMAEEHDVDGVWWRERHDPERLSAPRGVILLGRLCGWSRTECDLATLAEFQDDPDFRPGLRP